MHVNADSDFTLASMIKLTDYQTPMLPKRLLIN
jgi:hypothetical protein